MICSAVSAKQQERGPTSIYIWPSASCDLPFLPCNRPFVLLNIALTVLDVLDDADAVQPFCTHLNPRLFTIMSQHSNAHLNMDGDSKHDVDADDLALANDVTTAPAVPSLWGVPLKYISCVVLFSFFFPRSRRLAQSGYAGRPELCVNDHNALF